MPSSSPRLGNGGPSTRHRTPTTVYILTAGRSPALGPFCTNYNKSLLPVGGKAVLSLLIRLFPQDRWTKFVIATGFEAQKVKDYVHCAHPNIDVTFVDVPNYDGPGSGPGASLLACKNAAVATAGETSPFYIVVGDLFISNVKEDGMATASWSVMQPSDLFPGGPGARDGATVGARPSGHRKRVPANSCNWVATQFVSPFGSDKYCNFALGEKGSVLQVKNRQIYGSYQDASWIGLAYVQNADAFWVGLETEVARKLELAQNAAPGVKVPPSEIVAGFEYMLESGYDLKARQYRSWVDIGSPGEYLDLVKEHLGAGFDYGKTGEHLYFCGGRVIKFFEDAEITAQRVARCQMVPGVFPNVDRFQGNFYSYKFIDGEVLYRKCDDHVFQMLLEFLETKVWPGPPSREGSTSHSDEQEDEQEFEAACFRFYVEKTRKRVAAYLAKYPDRTALDHADRVARINGVQVEGIQKLIDERVDLVSFTATYSSTISCTTTGKT
ncbi:unnamed protein product [Amoebophrya sp. A25]|nr:unnamed protein product [Amoebophrya sp. A25]|eukprot:GSA25T00025877001.1